MILFIIEKRFLFFVLFFFYYSCFFKKDQKKDVEIKSDILKEDFQILSRTLKEAHPGLYWYSDKPAMDHYLDSTYALMDHNMTSLEFFKMLMPVIAKLRCVHTDLRLPKDIKNIDAQFYRLLPLNFHCRNGKLYISKDFNNSGHEGAEVLSINKTATRKIFKQLLNSLPADGYNETFKYHLLSTGAFREGYALYFGQPDTFVIEAIDTGKVKPVFFTVKAKSLQELSETKKKTTPQPIYLHFRNDLNTAVLTINTFEINTRIFNDTIANIFEKIKEHDSKHLIIDLRQNGGGNNDNVSALFSFVASASFLHLKRAEMNTPGFTYLQHFQNPRNFTNLKGIPEPNGKYLINYRYAGTSLKNPSNSNLFKGDVVLLTSGNTISAASEFASIAHDTKRATIIGEETGGCYYGATGGNYIQLILPGSKLQVRIPTIRIWTAVKEDYVHQPKGRGTIPDYEVVSGINDILNNRDVQLEMALTLITEKKKKAKQK